MDAVINMELHNRKLPRLSSYDYSQPGSYFITLCTYQRAKLFQMQARSVGNGQCAVPHCSVANQIIHTWIHRTQNQYRNITIDNYVIMPDHLHFILTIHETIPGCSVPEIMRFFKTMTVNEYIRCVKSGLLPVFDRKIWQKSYYDHMIRNQQDYASAWEYIENNPAKWLLTHNIEP